MNFQLLDNCSTEFTSDGSLFPLLFEGVEDTRSFLQFRCCVSQYDYSSEKDEIPLDRSTFVASQFYLQFATGI